MFFTSYRSGEALVWRVSLETGDQTQLTHGAPVHPFSAALHPDGETLIVTRGAELGECSISPAGEWLPAAYKRGGEAGLVAGR